jgi:hypothetical protein
LKPQQFKHLIFQKLLLCNSNISKQFQNISKHFQTFSKIAEWPIFQESTYKDWPRPVFQYRYFPANARYQFGMLEMLFRVGQKGVMENI